MMYGGVRIYVVERVGEVMDLGLADSHTSNLL
jgi:hypothetical protein